MPVLKSSDGKIIINSVFYHVKIFSLHRKDGVNLGIVLVSVWRILCGIRIICNVSIIVHLYLMLLNCRMELWIDVIVILVISGMMFLWFVDRKVLMFCWQLLWELALYVNIFYNLAVGALGNLVYVVVKKKLAAIAQMSQVVP